MSSVKSAGQWICLCTSSWGAPKRRYILPDYDVYFRAQSNDMLCLMLKV